MGRSHLLSTAAQAALGVESAGSKAWLDTWVPKLKKEDPEVVLAALRALPAPIPEAVKARRTAFTYRGQRREQIRYAHFQEQGYPIGSGSVESAGTVVEARLKGSGMHWEVGRDLAQHLAGLAPAGGPTARGRRGKATSSA